jgi:hypothetical protein
VDSPGSGLGSLTASCKCGDEPSGSGATELVITSSNICLLKRFIRDSHITA